MKQATKRSAHTTAPAKSSAPNKGLVAKATRAVIYQRYFTPVANQVGTDGFIPQINGYGTPVFSQVGSHCVA